VNDQLHSPVALPLVPIGQEILWASLVANIKISAYTGNRIPVIESVASGFTKNLLGVYPRVIALKLSTPYF